MAAQVIKETATHLTYSDTYQFTVPKILISSADLPAEDGIPLESNWRRAQMDLLIELINLHWADRSDFHAGGNMFRTYAVRSVSCQLALDAGWVSAQIGNLRYKNHLV